MSRPSDPTVDPHLGTQLARYRLTKLLGKGGMGRVYLGVQEEIGGRVAIKILAEDCADSPELVDRFFAEARAVNLINHENIISVLDLARLPSGRPYIVMEYVEGKTLRDVAELGPAPLGGIVHATIEVLLALEAAHAAGVIHRDLKPDNVMITAGGRTKVLDFGIAKLASRAGPRTRTGVALGTPQYMPPEQIRGEANDARTDIYSIGIMLFELATGRRPFDGTTDYQLMDGHLHAPPPPARSLRPEIPASLEAVIDHALAKRPADRFQSARAMARALHHAASELPADQWQPLASLFSIEAPSISHLELPAVTESGETRRSGPGLGRLNTPTVAERDSNHRPPEKTPPSPRTRRRILAAAVAVSLLAITIAVIVRVTRRGGSTAPAVVATSDAAVDAMRVVTAPIDAVAIDAAVANDAAVATDAAAVAIVPVDAGVPKARTDAGSTKSLGRANDEKPIPQVTGPRKKTFPRVRFSRRESDDFEPSLWVRSARDLARVHEPDADLVSMTVLLYQPGRGSNTAIYNLRAADVAAAKSEGRLPCISIDVPPATGPEVTLFDDCRATAPFTRYPSCSFMRIVEKVTIVDASQSMRLLYAQGAWSVSQYATDRPTGKALTTVLVDDECP